MKKAVWKGTFCILVALLFILPANAVWMKMEGAKENDFLQMNSPIPQEERWMRTFGRLLPLEVGYSVQQTKDGGYILVATALYVTGGIWLIKVNANGIKEWDKNFGISGDFVTGECVQQTNDGGYIIVGQEIWGDYILLLKTDSKGKKEWIRTFGGPKGGWMWEADRKVQQTNDGGYIFTASTSSYGSGRSDVWLLKTDENGIEEWNKTFGGKDCDWGESVQQTNDGGYIIAGCTESYGTGDGDLWLIKTDANGDEEWNRTFDGKGWDEGSSAQQTNDGGYVIAGHIASYGADRYWLIKTDARGNEEWNRTFDGLNGGSTSSVEQTDDGGYIMVGTFGPFGDTDTHLIKVDSNGNLEWKRIFGKPKCREAGYCVRQTDDGGFIVVGMNQLFPVSPVSDFLFFDVWLIKTNKIGKAMEMEFIG